MNSDSQTETKAADDIPRCTRYSHKHRCTHILRHGLPSYTNKHTFNGLFLCSCNCVRQRPSRKNNILYLQLFFFFAVTIFYLSNSHSSLPPPLGVVCVSLISLSHTQQEVKVACALASAPHSLCPTRSHSVNDRTWLSGQYFHSANSPWRNRACPLPGHMEK